MSRHNRHRPQQDSQQPPQATPGVVIGQEEAAGDFVGIDRAVMDPPDSLPESPAAATLKAAARGVRGVRDVATFEDNPGVVRLVIEGDGTRPIADTRAAVLAAVEKACLPGVTYIVKTP